MTTKPSGEGMTPAHLIEMKRKVELDIPFTEEERKLILNWKIMQTLKDAGGEMRVGDMYKALGVLDD
jgi:hypothetical protein